MEAWGISKMRQMFTRKSADATTSVGVLVALADRRENRSKRSMVEADVPKVGMVYHSQRTGRSLIVTAIENDRIYYEVEGFATASPLFLPLEKFIHLVGLDKKPE
jgi:hypothetical protein